MNKRARKKRSIWARRDLHRILDCVLDINGMQSSYKAKTGNHPTTFLRIYGHTASVSVDVHKDGWEDGAVPKGFESSFDGRYFIGELTTSELAEKLDSIRSELAR